MLKQRALVATGLTGLVALAATITVVYLAASPSMGAVAYGGRSYCVPLPPLSVRVASSPGRASYVTIAEPDLRALFAARAGACGFRYVEQLGSGHRLEGYDVQLLAVRQRILSVLTRIDVSLYPLSPPPGGVVR